MANPVKKGRPSWEPAELLAVRNKETGYRYRWERNDPAQIMKARAEGWEPVSGVTSRAGRGGESAVDDGKQLTSVTEYRELVLMRIPEDTAEARNEYFANQSKDVLMASKKDAQDKLDGLGAGKYRPKAHGQIIID